jgi:hypothetical protein
MLERYHYPDDGVPIYIIIFMEHGMDDIVNNNQQYTHPRGVSIHARKLLNKEDLTCLRKNQQPER